MKIEDVNGDYLIICSLKLLAWHQEEGMEHSFRTGMLHYWEKFAKTLTPEQKTSNSFSIIELYFHSRGDFRTALKKYESLAAEHFPPELHEASMAAINAHFENGKKLFEHIQRTAAKRGVKL